MTRHRGRRREVRALLGLASDEAFVTGDLPTIEYLTGFDGSNATLALGPERELLVTDGRYREQAAAQCPDIEVCIDRDVSGALASGLTQRRLRIDDRSSASFVAALRSRGFSITAIADPVAAARMAKDADEQRALAAACAITAQALADIAASIAVGQREVEIARRLELRFAELGADDRAFPSIVGSGPNSAIPHHRPGKRALEAGDLLVIDCGAKVDGYHADMTRTFVVGAKAQPWQREIHALVEEARRAGIEAIRPGASAASIDHAARSGIAEAGYGEHFVHGTGHGVGLQIHEAPMLSRTSSASLPEGAVITVEPGIYLPGRGGVRIEDTVVVANPAQVLTTLERGLTRVG